MFGIIGIILIILRIIHCAEYIYIYIYIYLYYMYIIHIVWDHWNNDDLMYTIILTVLNIYIYI